MVRKDDMVPDLVVLPSKTNLHAHPCVMNGSIFLQVLDACSAPGNKTAHLAALMRGKGKIIACSCHSFGSRTSVERLDLLLPSYRAAQASDFAEIQRVKKLAAFQRKALAHALSFPGVERVVYSTCSIFPTENEDVVKSVLPLAASLNFQLESPFPQWPCSGLPVFEGSEHLLSTDPVEDIEGFFIALFVKKRVTNDPQKPISCESKKFGNSNKKGNL